MWTQSAIFLLVMWTPLQGDVVVEGVRIPVDCTSKVYIPPEDLYSNDGSSVGEGKDDNDR